ncbi:MAG: hypothetical protein KF831_08940 [Acidobacteria bacterium]|nr:hypothetical protein [Acidobacteriota bacterium]
MAVSLNRLRSGSISALGFNFLVAVGVFFLFSSLVAAQGSPPRTPGQDTADKAERDRQMSDYLRRTQGPFRPGDGLGWSYSRPPVPIPTALKARLEISPDVKSDYAGFLKSRRTGVFKLLGDGPEKDSLADELVAAEEERQAIFWQTSTFSFREKELGAWLGDISYTKGKIIGTAAASHLIFTQLETEDIASVTAETPGMPFLASFVRAKSFDEVVEIGKKLAPGISDGGFRYTTSTWPRVGKVYGLRIVAYGFRRGIALTPGEMDLLLAFKIAGQDEYGDLTIVWKELHRKRGPVFVLKD